MNTTIFATSAHLYNALVTFGNAFYKEFFTKNHDSIDTLTFLPIVELTDLDNNSMYVSLAAADNNLCSLIVDGFDVHDNSELLRYLLKYSDSRMPIPCKFKSFFIQVDLSRYMAAYIPETTDTVDSLDPKHAILCGSKLGEIYDCQDFA